MPETSPVQLPLRIVVTATFADYIEAALDIPATLTRFDTPTREHMAALLADADVLISGSFAAGWVAPGSPLRLIQSPGAGIDGAATIDGADDGRPTGGAG